MKNNFSNFSVLVLYFSLFSILGKAQAPVEIYTMPGCGRCAYSIEYVKKNKIKYIEYDTDKDANSSKMWALLQNSKDFKGGSITMPVIVKGGLTYFNIDNLESFMAGISSTQNQNTNQNIVTNQNQKTVKKTGCISGNCIDGYGVYLYDNKDKYEGEFVNNLFSGNGKYTWANDAVYDGEWKNGKQDGYGVYTDENGNAQKGKWKSVTLLEETIEDISSENSNNTSSDLSKAQIKEFIDIHNAYRSEVKVGHLTWNNELATYAKAWGEHLAKIGCEMEHRPKSGEWAQKYGENLFWCSGYAATPTAAVNSWGEEKPDYDGGVMNNKNFIAGHYTQMIWAKTTQVGCAIVVCSDGSYLVVCNYNPPGNYFGQSPLMK